MKRAALAFALLCACSDSGGSGNVQIFVVPEDSIVNGIVAGTDTENIQDGWTVTYSRYLASVGNFRARRSDTNATLSDPSRFILDLKSAPTSGYVTTTWSSVDAVMWDKFGYDVPNATAGALPLPPTKQSDVDFMIANHYSVYYEGSGTKDNVTITFEWGFSAGTSFDDCASPDGTPGFAVPSGGTVQVKPTLHGDHEFFDNVTQGVEITTRLAQWLSTCDLDGNHDVTIAELRACDVVTALPQPPYDLSGVADADGDGRLSVFDYVFSEMQTFGHYQGDGECGTRTRLP